MRTQREQLLLNAALEGLEARLRRVEKMIEMVRRALRQRQRPSPPPVTWTAAQRRRQSQRLRAIWKRRREKGQ